MKVCPGQKGIKVKVGTKIMKNCKNLETGIARQPYCFFLLISTRRFRFIAFADYIISLEQRLNNTVAELQRTLVQHEEMIVALQNRRLIPCAGWYSPNNGFQYQLSSTKQNWQESTMLCQQIGGDLAALGIKNFHMRKKVADNLFPTTQWIWIGMTDLDREGHFNWIDGNPFNDPSPGWKNSDPNNARNNEHCVGISHAGDPPHLIYDIACDATLYALCEKSAAAACQ
ncbi:CD209 antigen-like protein D isoform X1 [Clavelina lepadiformis]|uniref:CD209 antigen-like protein D isoform X1 n=1 Tax=Clavelina lepadiformis TaxID=159417 RepID=UPI0040413135